MIVEPDNPNETLFEFENVTADKLLLVPPALILMFVSEEATDAVMLVPSKPNDTLLPFENVTAETFELDAPAEMLILP